MKPISFFTMIAVSALLANCGDPIASSSMDASLSSLEDTSTTSAIVSSSETTTRLLVSEMMKDMENGNYTMSLTVDSFDIYYYEVAQPLIFGSLFDPENNETINFYLDLTNEESSVLYTQTENNQWLATPLDPFSAILLLSPLGFIDPLSVEDDWFSFDETEGVYVLSPSYYDDWFVGVDSTEDLDEVIIYGDPETGDIQIIVKSIHPEDESLSQTITISYTQIGTTQVSLPTDLLDYPTFFINMILEDTTNHSFIYTIEENLSSTEENPIVLDILGQRDGKEFLLTDFGTFDQAYVNETSEGTFEQITSIQGATVSETIDQVTYDNFVNDFYPIRALELESAWIDLQQPAINPEMNVAMYPLLPQGIDALVNDAFLENATNLVGQVLFYESFLTGPLVNIRLEFDKDGTSYLAEFTLLYFDQTTIYPPFVVEPTNFLDILSNVQTLQNYSLSQTRSEGPLYEIEFYAERDGKTFEINDGQDFSNPSTFYEWDGVNYLQWSMDDSLSDYVNMIIDETTYLAQTTDQFLIDIDALREEDIIEDFTLGGYRLDPTSYSALIREDILEQYTIDEVFLDAYGSVNDFASLYISVNATNNTTSQSASWLMSLTNIGMVDVFLPGDDIVSNLLTLEAFQSLFTNGIFSTLGTLRRYSEQTLDGNEFYFAYNDTSAAILDPLAPSNEQVDLWEQNDNQLYHRYRGSFGSPLTNPTVASENDFFAFKASLPSFNVMGLTSNDVTLLTNEPFNGAYSIESTFIEQNTQNILQSGDEVQSAWMMLEENELSLTIHVINNNELFVIELEMESLNSSFDLKQLIEGAQPN